MRMTTSAGARFFALVCALSSSACDAEPNDDLMPRTGTDPAFTDPIDNGVDAPPLTDPGSSPLRRLTKFQIENTVAELLGEGARAAVKAFPEDDDESFDTLANRQSYERLHAERHLPMSEALAKLAVAKFGTCNVAMTGEEGCARQTIEQFGKRLFRRPVTMSEVDRFTEQYTGVRAKATHAIGLEWMIVAMFQSPRFLYLKELGDDVVGNNVKLTSYEVASRLSYFLWQSMPDEELFAAAERNELQDGSNIAAQTERMIKHPRARASVTHFHRQWLGSARFEDVVKDPKLFPTFPEVRAFMAEEARLFLDAAFWEDGTVKALFTAPYTFVNAPLAKFYELPAPTGMGFQKVQVDPSQRAGFLTQGLFLARVAHPDQTSTTLRGKFIRENVLCRGVAAQPAAQPIDGIGAPKSARERGDQLLANPCSRGCHIKMDTLGFAFENFDAAGRWRTTENNRPVNANAEIVGVDPSIDGKVNGAVALGARLAGSTVVKDCITTQWFRYGTGRAPEDADKATLTWLLKQGVRGDDLALRSILTNMTRSAAMRLRRKEVSP